MKYFITILITSIAISAFWMVTIKYDKAPASITCNEECEYEKIKKQKEMEMRAEAEIMGLDEAWDDLKYLDNTSNTEKEYRLRIEAMNQDLHLANTKGYAGDKEVANAILEKVEQEARDILKTNFFRNEVLALLDKTKEIRDNINN